MYNVGVAFRLKSGKNAKAHVLHRGAFSGSHLMKSFFIESIFHHKFVV